MNFKILYFFIAYSVSTFLPLHITAQKKVLDHTVYDTWKSISDVDVTHDGKIIVTVVKEQEGNDYLQIKHIESNKNLIIPRGYKYSVSPNQKHVIALIKAPYEITRQAKIKKVPDEKLPKDSLAIISLGNLSVTKIPTVKDFKIGKDFSDYVAYIVDDTLNVKDKKYKKSYTLVLRNLVSAKEDTISHVSEYTFSANGKSFSAVIKPFPKDTLLKNGVLFVDLDKYKKNTISEGKTIYKDLALSENGDKLVFLATSDSIKKEIKDYSLYYYSSTQDSVRSMADSEKEGMPKGWTVSDNFKPYFSKDEKRIILGIAPITLPKDTTIPDFEKAKLDIWHWEEPQIQPMQLVQLEKKLKQSYLSLIDLDNPSSIYPLGNEEIPEIMIGDENNGRYALGISNLPYQFEAQWDIKARSTKDIWLFDLKNKNRKKIKDRLEGKLQMSPSGNYLSWYDLNDRQYYVYSFESNKEICLTDKLNVNFWDEKYDMPSVPDYYGFSAWTENDEALLVYDAYDIWKLDPSGKNAPENLTKGVGREKNITLRYVKIDPESRFIKNGEKILLSAFDNTTKQNGYYELDKSYLKPLVLDKFTYTKIIKAKSKDLFCYTKSNFNSSPNLFVTSNNWKTEVKLTDINPQMKDYNWGTAELVTWTTFDGKQTEGIIYKPEDFDPNKKYPVMIYFYEKHSDNLYQYFPPAPSRSIINIPFYCSRGYIVFTPDIQYTIGHPGESAYNSIVSGAEILTKNSWIDEDNMAIQGQSWGGYQVAYLVTRTNMFKAAGAGAPVSNMFSAYGGIRWQTGMSRQYQYEQTQSRIGTTMWESPDLYKENSPIFYAYKVNTPLLIMHNDNDGAVPWYQGIEYFMGLRRLKKPVWMLQYNNEEHNLKERRNCKDLSIRLQQFFDHYLKGAPMPMWMKTGVPAINKGKDYGFKIE